MADKKVVTIDDKIPGLKEKRKKRSNRRLLVYLSIFFLLILLVIYFQSPLSHVRNIDVAGNIHTDNTQIIRTSGVEEGVSLWDVDRDDAKENIEKLAEIKEVTVKRKLPSTIQINVVEHQRIAYVSAGGDQYIPILKNGKVLLENKVDILPADAPVLYGFEEGPVLQKFAEQLSQLGNGITNRISEIHFKEEELVTLYMNDGIEVESVVANFAEYMSAYPSVAAEIDPDIPGVLHMKMTPYFEADQPEEESEEESIEEDGEAAMDNSGSEEVERE
ncbi:cell division protein FtsQ [Alteribacillus persepolensis]|uniref:Cell division protein DivIB n=1 Tax=Alteribacillus persepolensis TaxID=568899 RepID=A0A1G7YF70_9BACI|nr:FtsQ-type POTRA domain-containing protein [Alteribacillus persepolensis]SDG95188.1 cell division protein FtsQ [Alteribacillus persepolensis]